MPTRSWFLAGASLLAALAGFVVSSGEEPTNTSGDATYRLSNDGSAVVLSKKYEGGLTRERSLLQLFGDGRLIKTINGASHSVAHLSLAEMKALVQIAVDGGLLEVSQQDLVDTSGQAGLAVAADAGTITLSINLEEYAAPGQTTQPRTVEFRVRSPQSAARQDPDNRPLSALAAINERLLIMEAEAAP